MRIKSAEFIKSLGLKSEIEEYENEILVVGRSNVGKSSFINFLANNKKLARISSTPGATRLVNLFRFITDYINFTLVDLPGYGFANVSKEERQSWKALIENYISKAKNIKTVFHLVDIRREVSADDKLLTEFFLFHNIPFTVVATKTDKVSRAELMRLKQNIASGFKVGLDNIYAVSAVKRSGLEEILARLEQILSVDNA
jgi:GTP-binding protein